MLNKVKKFFKLSIAEELCSLAEEQDETAALVKELEKLKTTTEMPQREVLHDVIETSKILKGGIFGKICPVCGSYNFPQWVEKCKQCAIAYKEIEKYIEMNGATPEEAISKLAGGDKPWTAAKRTKLDTINLKKKMISEEIKTLKARVLGLKDNLKRLVREKPRDLERQKKIIDDLIKDIEQKLEERFKELQPLLEELERFQEESSGLLVPKYRQLTKRRLFLGPDALRTIWESNGVISLKDIKAENLTEKFRDKKGLVGIPPFVHINYLLSNLNVQREEKEIYDPKTETIFTGKKEVKKDIQGKPIPLKLKDKDYFSLMDISKKLEFSPTEVLRKITEYNTNLPPNKQIKPIIKLNELSQIFSWKNAIGIVFAERIKEVFNKEKLETLAELNKLKISMEKEIEKHNYAISSLTSSIQKVEQKLASEPYFSKLNELENKSKRLQEELNKIEQHLDKNKNDVEAQSKKTELIVELKKLESDKKPLLGYSKGLKKVTTDLALAKKRLEENKKEVIKYKRGLLTVNERAIKFMNAFGELGQEPKEEITAFLLDNVKNLYSDPDLAGEVVNPEQLLKGLEEATEPTEKKSSFKFTKKAKEEQLELFPRDPKAELQEKLKLIKQKQEEEKAKKPEEKLEKPTSEQLKLYEYEIKQELEDLLKAKRKKETKEVIEQSKLSNIPTEKEVERVERIFKNSDPSKLPRVNEDEAMDRLVKEQNPLALKERSSELTTEEAKELKQEIKNITSLPITKEEMLDRLIGKRKIKKEKSVPLPLEFYEPAKKKEESFSEMPCPHCKEKKIMKNKCFNCGYEVVKNRKDVIVETVKFLVMRDESGNVILKTDETGAPIINPNTGEAKAKYRPVREYCLVSVQYDEESKPQWAMARKATVRPESAGAAVGEEKEEFYKKLENKPPQVRPVKPVTRTKEDYRETLEGEKIHKQKCFGAPEPGVKVKPEEFDNYPLIKAAVAFIEGRALPERTRAWLYQDVYSPLEET